MKFTKEQVVQEMNKRFAKDKDIDLGRTISECVDNALKMVGENDSLELDSFCDMVQPLISTAVGLSRFHAKKETEPLQHTIEELKKGGKDGSQQVEEPTNNANSDDNNALKEVLERLKKLEEENASMKRVKAIGDKRKEIASKVAELGVKDEKWINAILSEVNITEDMDVEQKSKDYVELYNKFHASIGEDVTPKSSGGKPSEKIDLSGLDEALKQLRGGSNPKDNN